MTREFVVLAYSRAFYPRVDAWAGALAAALAHGTRPSRVCNSQVHMITTRVAKSAGRAREVSRPRVSAEFESEEVSRRSERK